MKHSIQSLNPEITASTAKWGDLLDDASMTLNTVVSQIRAVACELGEFNTEEDPHVARIAPMLFGTLYLAEIAETLLIEGHSRALKANLTKDS